MKHDLRDFISSIENDAKREDCKALIKIMEEESGYSAALRGQIVGFGLYHYKYESGREGEWIVTGFSPRVKNISIYIIPGFSDYKDNLALLGEHKVSKSCLYIKKLSDIDEKILRELVKDSVRVMKNRYECRDA